MSVASWIERFQAAQSRGEKRKLMRDARKELLVGIFRLNAVEVSSRDVYDLATIGLDVFAEEIWSLKEMAGPLLASFFTSPPTADDDCDCHKTQTQAELHN